ncbi:T9SS type A sorting domain-containing protein [Carboxylicivirga sp. RSCT41]|uniref:T9SS type A sorting domain-containing protein n=1 Tax=Carboxylicivirga agarovorans TaxID=3417570 RepID=UPI003D3469C8
MKFRSLLCKKSIFTLFLSALVCSSAISQELITNGNFESYTAVTMTDPPSEFSVNFNGWTSDITNNNRNNTRDLRYADGEGINGSIAAMILSAKNNTKGKLIQEVSGIDSTKTYLFSVYVKAASTSTIGQPFKLVTNAVLDGSHNGSKTVNAIAAEEYVKYGIPVIINSKYDGIKTQIQCNPDVDINTRFYIDNASLTEVSNFINLDFEEGIHYVWKSVVEGTATIDNEAIEINGGTNAANLTLATATDTATISNDIRVPITLGKQYAISAMAKVLADNGNADSLKIVAKMYDDNHDVVRLVNTRFDVTNTYKSYTNTVVVEATEKYMAIEIEVWNQAGSYIIDDVSVTESIANSTNDILVNDIKVYPNPANDYINIQSLNGETLDVKIYDITGKFAMQQRMVRAGERIDIQSLSKGIYVIEARSANHTSISKFVKK